MPPLIDQVKQLHTTAMTWLRLSCLAACLASGIAQAAFVDRGTGVIYDTATKLDWEQSPKTAWVNYADAYAYINALTLDGGGWRMPTMNELFDLYKHISADTGCADCSGDQGLFNDLTLGYWTTQTYWGGQPGAIYVGFWRGPDDSAGLFQTSLAGVMAVRNGSPIPEPDGLALLGLAALAGILATRRKRNA